jgi:2,4-dienoyl-CoA reductase-like NADH-dependent reductase (Old Yellow Enzyme family)
VDEVPRELERDEIRRLVRLFREAVRRAYEAEFDALEIHGGHGFLLDQFTSPLSNRRTDEYGGSFDNRIRFPLEVVEGIRKTVGSGFLLFYNLGGYSGTSLSESEAFARRLVQAGVSIIDVSGNLIGSRPDGMLSQECALPLAEKIKQAVQVPVVGGGIKDPQIADAAIRQGRVDLVGVSGAMLADPDWAAKAAEVLGYKAYSYWGWATKAKQC